MPYELLYNRLPKIAERETRSIIIIEDSDLGLPAGQYGFLEMFCNEPGCDCRRVFFHVVSSSRIRSEAVITYGWESPDYYAKWMGDSDPETIRELQGPSLNLCSPQTKLAPAILELFKNVLLPDEAYIERVKRHYEMFREKIDSKRKFKSHDRKRRRKVNRRIAASDRKQKTENRGQRTDNLTSDLRGTT